MKKQYQSPQIAVERFVLNQQITSCSAVKINLMDSLCIIRDGDATPGMLDLALDGYFLAQGLCEKFVGDGDDDLCYNTSSNLAFTS